MITIIIMQLRILKAEGLSRYSYELRIKEQAEKDGVPIKARMGVFKYKTEKVTITFRSSELNKKQIHR